MPLDVTVSPETSTMMHLTDRLTCVGRRCRQTITTTEILSSYTTQRELQCTHIIEWCKGSWECIVAERIDRQLEATYIADESISMILQYVSDVGTLIVIPRLFSGKTLDDLT